MEYTNSRLTSDTKITTEEFTEKVVLKWKDIFFIKGLDISSSIGEVKELELAEAIQMLTIALEEAIEEANQLALPEGVVQFD